VFISVPIGWASPIRLPNRRPTEQLVMFDPDAPAHVSSTAYYLLPERVRGEPDQLAVTHNRRAPVVRRRPILPQD
jgi:hypothetical protein